MYAFPLWISAYRDYSRVSKFVKTDPGLTFASTHPPWRISSLESLIRIKTWMGHVRSSRPSLMAFSMLENGLDFQISGTKLTKINMFLEKNSFRKKNTVLVLIVLNEGKESPQDIFEKDFFRRKGQKIGLGKEWSRKKRVCCATVS